MRPQFLLFTKTKVSGTKRSWVLRQIAILCCWAFSACVAVANGSTDHGIVLLENGRFAGWPANNGIWSWGAEIVVGFTLAYYKDNPGGHAIDSERSFVIRQARSLDGGESWSIETPAFAKETENDRSAKKLQVAIDFMHPDLALRFRWDKFYYSLDRCRTWNGPYRLPKFGRPELLARTDYIVEGKQQVTAFLAAAKEDGGEGQPLCVRTTDGGLTWKRVGWIGKQPPPDYGYAIMPATVSAGTNGYLSLIRRGGVFDGQKQWWLEAYLSPDHGTSWYRLDQPRIDNGGNPATLTRLADHSLLLVYGWRHSPAGIRGRMSQDNGQTWSREIILRCDGASWDLGYPRTVQRPDGKCVTVYYYHGPDQPERYIGYTIFDPMELFDSN